MTNLCADAEMGARDKKRLGYEPNIFDFHYQNDNFELIELTSKFRLFVGKLVLKYLLLLDIILIR